MLNKIQQEILDLVGGAEEWQDIVNEFGGQSKDEIEVKLNEMYPRYYNRQLAVDIYNECLREN